MTIILFLIDTSSSMNQRTYLGARPTLLDVAKDTVEKFLKARARDVASRGDRYMLLTFEDPPHNIKAGWKESHAVFMNELKHLTATGVTNMGPALKNAFDLLNLNRMQSGIDTYGIGRAPYYLEPSMIIVITDGSSLTNQIGVQSTLELPMQNNAVPGSELTREPFRWDQRLYSLVLRLTGTPPFEHLNGGLSAGPMIDQFSSLTAMCAVTAGRSYTITTQRSILQSIDALVQKVQSGVVIQFEKVGPDPPPIENVNDPTVVVNSAINENNKSADVGDLDQQQQSNHTKQQPNDENTGGSTQQPMAQVQVPAASLPPNWHSTRSLIYVHRQLANKNFPVGHWPIPEAFWPDPNITNLPPRTAHPIVKFSCSATEPHMLDLLPFDKYELESSPLTQYIISRKQPHVAWQVYVSNSGKQPNDLGAPFGYLKAATSLNCVNLFVMPYNYPMLLPIIDDILKKPQYPDKPPREWKPAFHEYLRTMPPYYATPLKRALTRMGATGVSLIPDNLDGNCLSYAVASKLKTHKNEAKAQFERLVMAVQHQQTNKNQNLDVVRVLQCGKSLRSQVESTSYRNMVCTGQPAPAFYFRYKAMKSDLNEFPNFVIRVKDKANTYTSNENTRAKHTFRNPYDIDRKDLIDQIHLMRSNIMQSPARIRYKDEDQIHTLPISQMGNYQDYLKKQPAPLREIESTPVRQHMFGNPFKIDKKGMMVDEADSLGVTSNDINLSQKNKKLNPNQRRRGPLPKDFIMLEQDSWRRSPNASPTSSPDQSPCASPAPQSDISFASTSNGEQNHSLAISPESSTTSSSSSSSISSGSSSGSGSVSGSNSSTDSSSPSRSNSMSLGGSELIFDDNHKNHRDNISMIVNNSATITTNNSKHPASTDNNIIVRPTEQDLALRSDIFKHIRGPGMNYSNVLKTISMLKGEKKRYILEETIREAKRFKKVRLLHQLNVISRQ